MVIPVRLRASFAAAALVCALASSGCLVVSLQPIYDDESVGWDETLVGTWRNAEDNIEVSIDRAEWRSYRIHYKHPVDTGDFTAYLTTIGDTRYLDLMSERGHDFGPLLIPAHAVLRLERRGDALSVSLLDYDRLSSIVRRHRRVAGLEMTMDQKKNVVLTGSTTDLRRWLRSAGEDLFDAPAIFTKVK